MTNDNQLSKEVADWARSMERRAAAVPVWARDADRRKARAAYVQNLNDLVSKQELARLCRQLRLDKRKIQQHEPAVLLWHYAGKYRWQEAQPK